MLYYIKEINPPAFKYPGERKIWSYQRKWRSLGRWREYLLNCCSHTGWRHPFFWHVQDDFLGFSWSGSLHPQAVKGTKTGWLGGGIQRAYLGQAKALPTPKIQELGLGGCLAWPGWFAASEGTQSSHIWALVGVLWDIESMKAQLMYPRSSSQGANQDQNQPLLTWRLQRWWE